MSSIDSKCSAASPAQEHLYYDGACGLCHRAVRFVLAKDRDGTRFRFAPLQGPTFERRVPAEIRAQVPDSIVVETREGEIIWKWRAVRHILRRLDGPWRLLSLLIGIVPGFIGDYFYDFVARIRHRLFARPEGTCPVLSPTLRTRFDP